MEKRAFLASLLFLFLLLILLPENNSLFSQKFLTREEAACEQLEKGEIDQAINILEKELKAKPDNLNARLYLGIAFYLKRNLERASKELEKTEKDIDRMLGSSRPFGDEAMFTQLGMDRKAGVLFSEERKGLLYFFRGVTLKEKKDLKNAEKKFKKAQKSKYDKTSLSLQFIDLYLKKKDLKSATKKLNEFKKISGESQITTFLDGYIQYKNKNLDASLASFEKIADAEPGAKKNIGCLHYNKGEFQKAIETWDEILSQHPEDKEVQINLGRAYFQVGDATKAQEYFDKAGIKIPPSRYSPKQIPLIYETVLKEVKLDLQCVAKKK